MYFCLIYIVAINWQLHIGNFPYAPAIQITTRHVQNLFKNLSFFFFASVAVFAGARGHEESCTSPNPSCVDRDCKFYVILLWWMLTKFHTWSRFLSRFYLCITMFYMRKWSIVSKMLWTKLYWSSSSQNVLVLSLSPAEFVRYTCLVVCLDVCLSVCLSALYFCC
jgi:hypothetical protein